MKILASLFFAFSILPLNASANEGGDGDYVRDLKRRGGRFYTGPSRPITKFEKPRPRIIGRASNGKPIFETQKREEARARWKRDKGNYKGNYALPGPKLPSGVGGSSYNPPPNPPVSIPQPLAQVGLKPDWKAEAQQWKHDYLRLKAERNAEHCISLKPGETQKTITLTKDGSQSVSVKYADGGMGGWVSKKPIRQVAKAGAMQ